MAHTSLYVEVRSYGFTAAPTAVVEWLVWLCSGPLQMFLSSLHKYVKRQTLSTAGILATRCRLKVMMFLRKYVFNRHLCDLER